MTARKQIALTLRLDAKFQDTIDYLKMERGALTRVIEDALSKVVVDKEVVKSAREAQSRIKEIYMTDADTGVKEFKNV